MDSRRTAHPADCLDHLRRDIASMTAERDRQAERAAALTRELVRAETLLADTAELRTRLAAAEVDLDEVQDELESANAQIENLTRELEAMQATVSWRVTSALRAVRRLAPPRHSR